MIRLRIVTIYLVTLIVMNWSQSATAQETRCLTADELNAVTDYLCERARQKELQYDALRLRYDESLTRLIATESKLDEYRGIDARRIELERELAVTVSERVSKTTVLFYVVGGFTLGVGVGAAIVLLAR